MMTSRSHRNFALLTLALLAIPCLAAGEQPNVPELPDLVSHGRLAILSVTPNKANVGKFDKFELTVQMSATYDNPFDPDQIDLTARFTSPSGKTITVPGFFYQPYRPRGEENDAHVPLLDADGKPRWKVRFAPQEVGKYSFQVHVRDRSGEASAAAGSFQSVPSPEHGFIRVSRDHPRYFAYEDGTPFVPVGQNLQNDWPTYNHSKLLAEAGCNAVRAWVFCHWTWLEWTFNPNLKWAAVGSYLRSYGGVGNYNQRIVWIADECLDRWKRDGLQIMFCLGNSGELGDPNNYSYWGGNPYNIANGGFLKNGSEFWTDARARKLYKQRLRYIVARYGYSSNVWAWELWNELGRETDAQVAWLTEMSHYLKQTDPGHHLVTTSNWGTNAELSPRTWAIPDIDFTQTHNYAGAETIHQRTLRMLAISPKPHIIGEGGGPGPGDKRAIDPGGIDFHNSLWAAITSGAAGTTLPWWWRERIEPNHLFWHYAAIAGFLKQVPWATVNLQSLSADAVNIKVSDSRSGFSPVLVVPLGNGWGSRAPRNQFSVQPDGTMPDAEDFSPVCFGSNHPDWANPPTITLTYPTAGKLVVRVTETSHAVLEVDVDGKPAVRDDSLDVARRSIDRDLTIDVPPGRHRVTLRNVGHDWVRIGHLLLTNYRDARKYPDIDVYGIGSRNCAVLWFHNRLNEWAYRALGLDPTPINHAETTIRGLTDGTYQVEWWDTYKGVVTKTEAVDSRGGALALQPPPITRDAACLIRSAK